MRRRDRVQSKESLMPPIDSRALAISIRELTALVEVFGHAHSQIARLGNVDDEVIGNASGSLLIPVLYARAGLAASRRLDEIPLLVGEVGLLEAAVVNLESYGGNEVVLCSGYELLKIFATRSRKSRPLHQVHGVLAFVYGTPDSISGSVSPFMPGGGGPELVP